MRRVRNLGIEELVTSVRSPWQNGYVERVIGSMRRECLDHVVIFSEDHLRRVLADYVQYYNTARPHQSLDCNSPVPREVEPPEMGKVIAIPQVAGCITGIPEQPEFPRTQSIPERKMGEGLPTAGPLLP